MKIGIEYYIREYTVYIIHVALASVQKLPMHRDAILANSISEIGGYQNQFNLNFKTFRFQRKLSQMLHATFAHYGYYIDI